MIVISDFNSQKQHDVSILIPKVNAKYEVNSRLLGDNVKASQTEETALGLLRELREVSIFQSTS